MVSLYTLPFSPYTVTEGFSSSTLATDPSHPKDRVVIIPSPGLTRLSPVVFTKKSGENSNTSYGAVSMLISDDQLGQETPIGAFSLSEFPIPPRHDAESSHVLSRYMTVSDPLPRTPRAPSQSMLPRPFPTNIHWVSPGAQNPESSESPDQLDIVNAYTPAAGVFEPLRETSGIFAPTRGIYLSPPRDAPHSRWHMDQW